MKGKSSKGVTKCNDGKVKYMKIRNERIMGEKTCTKRCDKKKMCNEISDRQRKKIFHEFWSMNWDEKRIFVKGLIQILLPQSLISESSRRTRTLQYYLKPDGQQFVVSKQMFLATLGIGEKMMYDWLERKPKKVEANTNSYLSAGMIYAKEFFESLPKMPSHYCCSATITIS